jgi:hypothetical protein
LKSGDVTEIDTLIRIQICRDARPRYTIIRTAQTGEQLRPIGKIDGPVAVQIADPPSKLFVPWLRQLTDSPDAPRHGKISATKPPQPQEPALMMLQAQFLPTFTCPEESPAPDGPRYAPADPRRPPAATRLTD